MSPIHTLLNRFREWLGSDDDAERAAGRLDALAGLPYQRGQGFDYRRGYIAGKTERKVR